jgi:hypothetical protein
MVVPLPPRSVAPVGSSFGSRVCERAVVAYHGVGDGAIKNERFEYQPRAVGAASIDDAP